MNSTFKTFISLSALVLTACASVSTRTGSNQQLADQQTNTDMMARYQRAEQLLPVNLRKKVENLYINPVWIEDGGFWYQLTENELPVFRRYHPESGIKPLFELDKLAAAVGYNLAEGWPDNFRILDVVAEELTFQLSEQHWQCRLVAEYECHEQKDDKKSEDKEPGPLTSPDGKWQIVVKNHNLILVNNTTEKEEQLTSDGTVDFPYATESANPKKFFNKPEGNVEPRKIGYWSPDSRYFITFQLDLRNVGKLQLMQSVTGESQRPRFYEYRYPMAGDEHLIKGHIILVDAITGKAQRVDNPPLNQTYYGDPLWGEFSEENKYYFVERERGFHQYYLKEFTPTTGQVRTLISESNEKFIDPWVQDFRVMPEQDMVLWTSERNGMQQLFSYQLSTGKLLNEVTPKNMFMRVIRGIDSENRELYFEASGARDGDAYYRYLYRVKLDGTDLTLLTPEQTMHDTRVSPDFSTFIDRFSTVQQPTQHAVRSTVDGRVLAQLATLDDGQLRALGYVAPEPFSMLAQDGKTQLDGILYFPSDFDPNKSYPILDDIYTGPHGYFTPKTFDGPLYSHAIALAELGFVVLKMDGRGTGKRDRQFHEYSYDNLAGGADDHVWALTQLAKTRPYLDLKRVGIYGFSAGGYDTVRAMYKYPDFFKVGVSASGNHDFRADKAGWNETWMGYPVGEHWDEQSNLTDAHKLQGRLLLAHGELDENVHPAATLQLVDKLIKANKDFEFLMYPNMGHVLHYHPHFVRTRWDFFVEHLLNISPPEEYQIDSMEIPELAR